MANPYRGQSARSFTGNPDYNVRVIWNGTNWAYNGKDVTMEGALLPSGTTASGKTSSSAVDIKPGFNWEDLYARTRASEAADATNRRGQDISWQQTVAELAQRKAEADQQYDMDLKTYGLNVAGLNYQKRLSAINTQLNDAARMVDIGKAETDVANLNWQQRSGVADRKAAIMGMLADRSGPQDWLKYDSLLNQLAPPTADRTTKLDPFEILKGLDQPFKLDLPSWAKGRTDTSGLGGDFQAEAGRAPTNTTPTYTPPPAAAGAGVGAGTPGAGINVNKPVDLIDTATGGGDRNFFDQTPFSWGGTDWEVDPNNPGMFKRKAGANNQNAVNGAGLNYKTFAALAGGGTVEPDSLLDKIGPVVVGDSPSGAPTAAPEMATVENPGPDTKLNVMPLKPGEMQPAGPGAAQVSLDSGGGPRPPSETVSAPAGGEAAQKLLSLHEMVMGMLKNMGLDKMAMGEYAGGQQAEGAPTDGGQAGGSLLDMMGGGMAGEDMPRAAMGISMDPMHQRVRAMMGRMMPRAAGGGTYGTDATDPWLTYSQYSPEAFGGLPIFKKLFGRGPSPAFQGFGAELSNPRYGIKNAPSLLNLYNFGNLSDSEQKMASDVYGKGLSVDWNDILSRSAAAAPYGRTSAATRYGG